MGNHGKLNETQGAEMDEMIAAESTNQEGQSESVVGNGSIKCGCCDHEFPLENMVQCANGHQICFECIKKWVEEILYGNGSFKAHGSLSCISVDGCEESIPLSEIRRALPNDVLERYELRQALECVAEAKLENLVYCPFCGIPYEVEKSVEVLDCQNQKCLKASCIQCKKPSHIPLRCEEVEEMSETARRTEVEEKKTKAVVRECNTCKVEIVKEGGCNKVTCPLCGTTMCYDCRETIASPYDVHVCRFSKEKTASFNKRKLCEKERRLAIKLASGEITEVPDENPKPSSAGDISEQEDDGGDSNHGSIVNGTLTYEDGDITTIVNTCELNSENEDVETSNPNVFPNPKSKIKIPIPAKKNKSFKKVKKGKKINKKKVLKKGTSRRLGKKGKDKR